MRDSSVPLHVPFHIRERRRQLLLALLGGALATLAFTLVGTPEVRLVALIGVGLVVGALLLGLNRTRAYSVADLPAAPALDVSPSLPSGSAHETPDGLVRYAWMRAPVCSEDAAARRNASELTPVTIVRVHSERERRRVEAFQPPGIALHAIVVDTQTSSSSASDDPQAEVAR